MQTATPMTAPTFEDATVLIIDEQETNARLVERMLEPLRIGNVHHTTDPGDVMRHYNRVKPDMLMLNLQLSRLDAWAIMEHIRDRLRADGMVPLVVISAELPRTERQRALSLGVREILTKPIDVAEALLRIRQHLEVRMVNRRLHKQIELLEITVQGRAWALEQAHLDTVARLARAAEYRDDMSGEHTQRVGQMSALLAHTIGLDKVEVELIHRAAPLHDVGKIGVPDQILLKPGQLTPAEFATMQEHTRIGAELLSGTQHPLLQRAAEIALNHHERWDGLGYPNGLQGEAIPVSGRIVAIADTFDALTVERPYKAAWNVDDALAEVERQAGRQFDPRLVEAFLHLVRSGQIAAKRLARIDYAPTTQ